MDVSDHEFLPMELAQNSSYNGLVEIKEEVKEEILDSSRDIHYGDVIVKEEPLRYCYNDEQSSTLIKLEIKKEDDFERNNGQDLSLYSESADKSNSFLKSAEPVRISASVESTEIETSDDTKLPDKKTKNPNNNRRRYKVCPKCKKKKRYLKQHLIAQHKLGKEEIRKIIFRKRKIKDNAGKEKLYPLASCGNLQGHSLKSKEIYTDDVSQNNSSIPNENANKNLAVFEILNLRLISTNNVLSDFESYLVENQGNDSEKDHAKEKRTKVQQMISYLNFHPLEFFCPENENKIKLWFLNSYLTKTLESALNYIQDFKIFIDYLMTVPDFKICSQSVGKMLVNIESLIEIVKKNKEPFTSTDELNSKDLCLLLYSEIAHQFNDLTTRWRKADFDFRRTPNNDWNKSNHSLVRNFIVLETILRTNCRASTLANITMKHLANCKMQGEKYILQVNELESNISNDRTVLILNQNMYFKYLTYAHRIRPHLHPDNQYLFQTWSGKQLGPDEIQDDLENLWAKFGFQSKLNTKVSMEIIPTKDLISNTNKQNINENKCKTKENVTNLNEVSNMVDNVLVDPVKDISSPTNIALSDENKDFEIYISERERYYLFNAEINTSEESVGCEVNNKDQKLVENLNEVDNVPVNLAKDIHSTTNIALYDETKVFKTCKSEFYNHFKTEMSTSEENIGCEVNNYDKKLDIKMTELVNPVNDNGEIQRNIVYLPVKNENSQIDILVNNESDIIDGDEMCEKEMTENTKTNNANINKKLRRLSDLKSQRERFKSCPICKKMQGYGNLKRHLLNNHELEKEEIDRMLYRLRKRKVKQGNGRLCPIESCAGLQGHKRLDKHFKRFHRLTEEHEIYRKYIKARKGKSCKVDKIGERKSIGRFKYCPICDMKLSYLKQHFKTIHGLTPEHEIYKKHIKIKEVKRHKDDDMSERDRLKSCPICKIMQNKKNLKRHLLTRHELKKEEIDRILYRLRKRRVKQGNGRLCPIESCAGLQGHKRLDKHFKRFHRLTEEHEIYKKYINGKWKRHKEKRNEANMMKDSDMVQHRLLNLEKDSESITKNLGALPNGEENAEIHMLRKCLNLEKINGNKVINKNILELVSPLKDKGGRCKSFMNSSIKEVRNRKDIEESNECNLLEVEKKDEEKHTGNTVVSISEVDINLKTNDKGEAMIEEIDRIGKSLGGLVVSKVSNQDENIEVCEENEVMDEEMTEIYNIIDREIELKVSEMSDNDCEAYMSNLTSKKKLIYKYKSLLPEDDEKRGQKSKVFSRNQKIFIFSGFIEYIHKNDKKPTVRYVNDKIQNDPELFFLSDTTKFSVPKIQGVLLNFLNKKKTRFKNSKRL